MAEIKERIQRDILICDDDKDICEILKVYCENMKCFKNIVIANDGISATQKLANQHFAVICLDINMPKKTGDYLIGDIIHGSMNSIDNILIISGTLDKHLVAKIVQTGVKNFLIKPFDEAQFQEKVLKVLGAKKT
jgi:response regulator of citrate/malate metabolism